MINMPRMSHTWIRLPSLITIFTVTVTIVLLSLCLLPILTKSKNVNSNHLSSTEDDDNAQYDDQIAQPSTWKTNQNRVISATYTGDPHTGRVDHANLVVNVLPRTGSKPSDVDEYASQTLANAKTAQDYVNKAIEMKHKYADHTTPSSSYIKYDIYDPDQAKTKLIPIVSSTARPPSENISPKEDISDMSKSPSEFTHEYIPHPQEYLAQQTTTTTYKHPQYESNLHSLKDLESSNTDYNHHYLSQFGDTYDSLKSIQHDNRDSLNSALRKLAGYPSKEEMIKYIERAVKKYLREMDLTGKLSSSPSAHAEIKTYYRFPSTTTASPMEATKLYNSGIHSEFFKPSKAIKSAYGSVKPFTMESYGSGAYGASAYSPGAYSSAAYLPEGIDLTARPKKRPKPLDLSTLDVGQSWSHSPSALPLEASIPYRPPKAKKPKIHINTQTYHDINAMPYVPTRGAPVYEDYSPYSTATAFIEQPATSGFHHSYSSHKEHPVGASISFGGHHGHHSDRHLSSSYSHPFEDSTSSKTQFVPSMQVVNGLPVKNPYKFNMETLNDIFGDGSEGGRTKFSLTENDYASSSPAIWNPYGLDLSSFGRDSSSSGSSYSYDTYNPKYNNEPEDQYYETYRLVDWDTDAGYPASSTSSSSSSSSSSHRQRGADMYSSGSSHRPKKTSPHVDSSNSKRAVTKLKPKSKAKNSKRISNQYPQGRELDRDLVPPPPVKKM